MDQQITPWIVPRSILFTPCDRLNLVEKAAHSKSDVVCLDLEDGVAPDVKSLARSNLRPAAKIFADADKPFYVRVNSELELLGDDLNALPDACHVVVLPKTLGFEHIQLVGDALDRIAGRGGANPKMICQIECSSGLRAIGQSGRIAHPRLCALSLGTEDLSAEIGCAPDADLIAAAFHQLTLSACALGLGIIGFPASIAEFHDLEAFRTGVVLGRECGADGGFCIHPSQIEILNDVYQPSKHELEKATKITEAFKKASILHSGVTVVDGKMIDRPIYLKALKTLSRARDRI